MAWSAWRFKTVTIPTPGFRRRMRLWLRRHHPDLIHTSLSFNLEDGWLARQAREFGIGAVATFHLPFGEPGSGRARVMRQLHRFWVPRLRSYQRVIVFSSAQGELLVQLGLDQGAIAVVPNAVDTARFSPGPSRLRRERLTSAELVLGYAGRLDPEKGVRELIAGFLAAGPPPRARLCIAGSGSLSAEVARSARHPAIVYLGQLFGVEERADFWRAVDLFCLPSRAEGLSQSLLEAMASGCAVAATPAGGADQVGEAVDRLDPHDPASSIAGLVERLASHPELLAHMGRVARERVVRHHGIAAMLDRVQGVYLQCLNPLAGDRRRGVVRP